MSEQPSGTISAIEFQELKIKAFLCDNLREQRVLEERLAKLKADERAAIAKLDELTMIAKQQAEAMKQQNVQNVPPKEDVVTLKEEDIDPQTGELRTPQPDKTQHDVNLRIKKK